MAKLILVLFAVFAVLQVQAAPGLYDRFFQDEELRDILDEPRMSDQRFDDLYSSPLARREECHDFHPTACQRAMYLCVVGPGKFLTTSNFYTFHKKCCLTCRQFQKKK
ncbi:hypothetical protein ACROYT_G024137 [Oculina patagonica]